MGSWYFSLPSQSIKNWDTFEEEFLLKFGDDWTTFTLINDLSNLKTNPNEKIKDFNSIFNKLLNKILDTSKPGIDMHLEWYISALPSNIVMFVDGANKIVLLDNKKEYLSMEKRVLALDKKYAIKERSDF